MDILLIIAFDDTCSFGLDHLRVVWRLSLGLGVIPAAFVFVWRLRMMEPELVQKNTMKHAPIPYWLVIKRYWLRLFGISLAWFIYDFVTYPVRLCFFRLVL